MSKKENTTTTLFVNEKPKSTISEKFRGIRSNIMFSKANGEVKRLLVTSEKPGAGKKVQLYRTSRLRMLKQAIRL